MVTPVLSILNMKGGVGKTTVSANVMRVLYQRMKKNVLLLDLDAQFNLTQSVLRESDYEETLKNGHTIMSCFEPLPSNDFFQIKKTEEDPPSASDICESLRKFRKDGPRLDLIPGSFDLMKYSMIDDVKQLKFAAQYLKRFISQARSEYDLIVLDCNPSSSFVTKCALENSSHVLSPVKLDKFSILGVGFVDRLFDHLDLQVNHMILVNGIKRTEPKSQIEIELRANKKFGLKVLQNRLVQSKLLSADPTYTGFAADKGGPYSTILKQELNMLSEEIANRLGIV